jgi:hypothetical protein
MRASALFPCTSISSCCAARKGKKVPDGKAPRWQWFIGRPAIADSLKPFWPVELLLASRSWPAVLASRYAPCTHEVRRDAMSLLARACAPPTPRDRGGREHGVIPYSKRAALAWNHSTGLMAGSRLLYHQDSTMDMQ